MIQDSGHIPYLAGLRIRFSATTEEIIAGVTLVQSELMRMAAMLDSQGDTITLSEIAPLRASQRWF